MNRELPNGPWEMLGLDIFFFQGNSWLLTIDYFSKYVEVAKINNIDSENVISVLKSQFSRHGIPYVVFTDPGTQLISLKMYDFAKEWNFTFESSSPKHSQSNGMVERHIATIKNIFKKLEEDPSKDPSLALLEYRNSPIDKYMKSPSEIMFNRKVRGLMPRNIDFQREKENENIRKNLIEKQNAQKAYYDKKAHDLRPLKVNDKVYVKKDLNRPNVPARVTKICNRPRSHELELENKRKIERNRKHIFGPVIEDRFENNLYDVVSEEEAETLNPIPVGIESNNENNTSDASTTYITKSGRSIKTPSYLTDYNTK